MEFCERLKSERLSRGYTQKELATLLDITERGYRNYEIGAREPSLSVLIKIADFYAISLDALVGRNVPKRPLTNAK